MNALPFEYLAFIIGWILFLFGYYIKDWTIKSIASIFFMVLGVYVLIYGMEGITNIATVTLGAIHLGVGFFVIIIESYDYEYKDM